MSEQTHIKDRIDSAEAAAYLAEMTSDLAKLARRHGFNALAFILDTARLEADTLSERDISRD